VAEDDDPLIFEDAPLFNDLEGVPFVEKAVWRVEEDEVEGRLFLAQVDDGAVELPMDDAPLVLCPASLQVDLDGLNGRIELLDKSRRIRAAAKRFNADLPCPGKPVEYGRSSDLVPDDADIEESFLELGGHRADERTQDHLQPPALERAANHRDHQRNLGLLIVET